MSMILSLGNLALDDDVCVCLCLQVLRLVHYLVKYGFYYKSTDIKMLLEPLMSLLDGRNDKPYPNMAGKTRFFLI